MKDIHLSQSKTYRGVRRRSWGRFVSEIRMPGTKTRIWLGSFMSADMAARAYDAAAFFLRGNSATLNFPESAGSLPRPDSASRRDIQKAAAKAAAQRVGQHPPHQDEAKPNTVDDVFRFFDDSINDGPVLSPLRLGGSVDHQFLTSFDAENYNSDLDAYWDSQQLCDLDPYFHSSRF